MKIGDFRRNFGQAAGSAIADILFGKVNPSARLPLTFPNTDNDQNMSPAQYPGLPDPEAPLYANYSEGLFVGYRYYDKHGIEPAFAFVKWRCFLDLGAVDPSR